ncbi:hypothetical protein [Saccharopolyspora phatthalungensis]|uniref:Uncharacterized protein n=1 Tax=Saccharopolyspora phatthalungensis TaxID=664693 RepID=A0A840QIG8_9PSEU|nr:hypothetical protein [Saccharopolyspora phatthalungensis]MBB5160057.1 hypothetical protein [Saccharopolyspora phatthalungensis]
MSATEADRAVTLATLLTSAAVALNGLAKAVLMGRATDDAYLDTERLLSELVDMLRDRCQTYVPPRVVDSKRPDP